MNREVNYIRAILLHCLLPLFIGALFYLFFRPPNFINAFIGTAYYFRSNKEGLQFFVSTIPDFLWCYSFASAMLLFFIYYKMRVTKGAIFILLLLVFSECIQYWLPKQFTFDYWDIVAAITAFILSYYRNIKCTYEKES